jgi:hypothetical protein
MQNRSTRPAAVPSRAAAAGLPVSPESPGLWISAWPNATPRAAYACRCGFVRAVSGRDQVIEFVTNHHNHAEVCGLKEGDSARRVTRVVPDAAGSSPEKAERPGIRPPDLSGGSASASAS